MPVGIAGTFTGQGFYTGGFEARLIGFKEIYDTLQKLPEEIRQNIMNKAMRVGAEIFLNAIRIKAPRGTGLYKEKFKGHMADAFYISKANWNFGVITLGLKVRQNAGFNAHFIEFGTGLFYKGTGKTVGRPYRIPKVGKKGLIAFPVTEAISQNPSYRSFLTKSPESYAAMSAKYGTSGVKIAQYGMHPGIRPRPFIRPAFDENVQSVITKVGIVAKQEIEKFYEKGTLRKAA